MGMSEIQTSFQPERPSGMGSFLRGFGSGAFNGALMMGIFTLISLPFGFPFHLSAFAITVATTGIFSGVMAAKRALFDTPSVGSAIPTTVPVPVAGMSGPAIAPVISPDVVPETANQSNWVEKTGGSPTPQSRIDAILANRAMSDKEHASAILAAREAATNETQTAARA